MFKICAHETIAKLHNITGKVENKCANAIKNFSDNTIRERCSGKKGAEDGWVYISLLLSLFICLYFANAILMHTQPLNITQSL